MKLRIFRKTAKVAQRFSRFPAFPRSSGKRCGFGIPSIPRNSTMKDDSGSRGGRLFLEVPVKLSVWVIPVTPSPFALRPRESRLFRDCPQIRSFVV